MTINTDDTRQTTDNSLIYRILLINSWEGLEYTPVVLRNDSPDASFHPSTQSTLASPQRIDLRSTSSNIHKVPTYNTSRAPSSPRSNIHRITKLPAYTVNSPPNHSLALSHPACIVCIVGVRERGIAPFLASVTDNGFKSVCQMTWIYSITQPHTDVHRIHISSSTHTSGK